MRKIAYLIGLAALMSSAALAETFSGSLAVSANVVSNCVVSGATLAFGAYDPIVGAAVTHLGSMNIACTSDVTAPVVTLGQGVNPATGSSPTAPLRQLQLGSTGSYLTYNIYLANHTTIWASNNGPSAHAGDGTQHPLDVWGQIDAGQNTAPAGAYADTVVITVTF
jgi:spore coat protein U-like protein